MSINGVVEREAAFFDEIADDFFHLSEQEQKKLLLVDMATVISNYPNHYQFAYNLMGEIKGKEILDMGCGDGKSSVIMAKKGAMVQAFDVSEKSLEIAKIRAKINNISDKIEFKKIFAERMEYPSAYFDLVFGVAILHHINLEESSKEIARVLKPGGMAIFIEPIAFSPLIVKIRNLPLIKALVPNKGKQFLITEDERQINYQDLDFFRKHFSVVSYSAFQLFSRLDRIIGGYPIKRNKWLIALINQFDRFLLTRFSRLSRFGRWGIIKLVK